MTNKELIEQLRVVQSWIEWDTPLDCYITIEEAIKVLTEIESRKDDYEFLLISAERYAYGRQTYAPDIVISYIYKELNKLSESTLQVLKDDLFKGLPYVDEIPYKDYWDALYNEVCAELNQRHCEAKDTNPQKDIDLNVIRPCPNCGSEDVFLTHKDKYKYVSCDNCKAKGNNFLSIEHAVEEWLNVFDNH